MAIILQNAYFSLNLTIILVIFLNSPCYCFKPKFFNFSNIQSDWSPAGATWYGRPDGDGSDGGACGYQDTVEKPPLSKLVSAGGPSLFKSGKGCGACYQVKCTSNSLCSGNPVQVVIADDCPGCKTEAVHFDLSGTAFGAMAKAGQADQLRNVGVLQIQYRRVLCNFPGTTVAFHIDSGSNPYYFSTVIEYQDGDGELGLVELQQGSNPWIRMQQSWGAVWKINSGSALNGPLSLRLTALESHKSIVANGVIPAGWQPGQTYRSIVNFPPN